MTLCEIHEAIQDLEVFPAIGEYKVEMIDGNLKFNALEATLNYGG